jgi:two-component system OmpR family response regulator
VRFGDWELDTVARQLKAPTGLVVALSNAEFRLLTTFLEQPNRLFTRDQLMDLARGRSMDAFERSIDLLVSRLRQKLADDPQQPSFIKTVRGAGYVFSMAA